MNETESSWLGPVLLCALKIQPLQQSFQSSPEKASAYHGGWHNLHESYA